MSWDCLGAEIAVEIAALTPCVSDATEASWWAQMERQRASRPAGICAEPGCSELRERVQGARFCEAHRRSEPTEARLCSCRCGREAADGYRTCAPCRTYHRERARKGANPGRYRCGVCGEKGHTARACGEREAA